MIRGRFVVSLAVLLLFMCGISAYQQSVVEKQRVELRAITRNECGFKFKPDVPSAGILKKNDKKLIYSEEQ